MNLHDLSPAPGSRRKPKRLGIGIGSGHGKTAGKGHKGQKARSGRSVSPYFEGGQMPLSRRIPKRGFSNFRFSANYQTVNVKDLEAKFDAGAVITPSELHLHRLVQDPESPVKILGDGDLSRSFTVRANAFSASAKNKIEGAGGKAEVI
ncbi:MAG: 50S ribosomal protein L15 [Synergistaceae bacterium]|jgi:large subunit ribosomal protein L15|nr:50S ribosomal protein L15 [Synergistaceae bacterium]